MRRSGPRLVIGWLLQRPLPSKTSPDRTLRGVHHSHHPKRESTMSARTGLEFIFVVALVVTTASHLIKYKYFDDYLIHLERRQQSILIQEIEVKITETLPLRTGYRHNKDEKCCMLGHLAGEKGFHCVSRFYAARILYRNYNRAHNKKIPSLLKGKPDPTADKLMRTFEQCVAHRGNIFHKCCRHASLNGI